MFHCRFEPERSERNGHKNEKQDGSNPLGHTDHIDRNLSLVYA
jgi:hypothetical protein